MTAILPSLHLDSREKKLNKYFLPWQLAWIEDNSRLRLWEKSVRIGATYCDIFKNVRKRIKFENRDYLVCSKDMVSAAEYLRQADKLSDVFSFGKYILSRGEETETISGSLPNGEKFTTDVKFCYMRFENGSRIIAFSSNPFAMAVYGGDVGGDEFAKHDNQELLYETMQGRIRMGYDLGLWSAHNGTDTLFYQFAQEARAGKGGWSYHRTTMADAVAGGLVEKINEWRGTKFTREGFLADCKNDARLPEIYEQAYNCNPSGSTSCIAPWNQIQLCQHEYNIPRVHLEANQITEAFGNFTPGTQLSRETRISNFIASQFSSLIKTPAQYRLGFDVAASGEGDLAVIYIDAKETPRLKLAGLFTCRTDDWNFLQTVLWTFHRRLPALQAAGDETGLGRQICWETAKRFPGQFTAVNFAAEKHDLGFALMNQLSVAEKIFPKNEPDIAQDFFSLRKIFAGRTWKFTEGRNLLNPASHCDIAWAGALATKADSGGNTWGGGKMPFLV
jgi:phage FluMu gp28-like protein